MLTNLIREDLRSFMPYETAKNRGEAELIRLHANESPWSVSGNELNRYPRQLDCEKIAKFYQVSPEEVLLTRGSNEGIDLLIRLFCQSGRDEILTISPSYGMYNIAAQLQGIKVNTVDLLAENAYAFDTDAILAAITPTTKILFICSPNNPTGNALDSESIQKLCQQTASQCLVVIDEAYIEFADRASASGLTTEYPNLVVLRTFSKAFGLAGLRVGIVLSNQPLIRCLSAIMPTYPIPTPCQALIEQALQNERILQMWINVLRIKNSRRFLQQTLEKLDFIEVVYPSEANFLLLKMGDADKLETYAAENGVLVRRFANSTELIRISVGTEADNSRLLEIFTQWGLSCEK